MTGHETRITADEADELDKRMFMLLKKVVQKSDECTKKDEVSCALFYFLSRVTNTWQSIKTLLEHSPDEKMSMLDAAVLLRAMLDACLQAEYIVSDADKIDARASDYLEYEHVERYKIFEKIRKHDNWLAQQLKSSHKWPDGEKRSLEEYNRVKNEYLVPQKRQSKGTQKSRTKTRNTWYSGNLREIAKNLGKEDEYDILITNLNGCVHSSALSVHNGPPMASAQGMLTLAATIAARVARLNVQHNRIEVGDLHEQILNELCKDHFGNNSEKSS